jgi:hypothetical protein
MQADEAAETNDNVTCTQQERCDVMLHSCNRQCKQAAKVMKHCRCETPDTGRQARHQSHRASQAALSTSQPPRIRPSACVLCHLLHRPLPSYACRYRLLTSTPRAKHMHYYAVTCPATSHLAVLVVALAAKHARVEAGDHRHHLKGQSL